METRQREGARHRFGPDFVKRQIHVLTEKQRVLYGFRHQRPGQLLETGAELAGGIAGLIADFAGQDTGQQRECVRVGVNVGQHVL